MSDKIKSETENCYLKFATEKDVPLILEFIHALAEYENMTDEVVADEATLQKYLFGEKKYAEVLLAYYNNLPVGFAFFFHNFSTFEGKPGIYLEDLFVKEAYRGYGIGTGLLRFIAKLALKRDCARLEWSVLDWNKPSIDFYKSLNAKPLNNWTTFRLTGSALKQLASK